MKQYNAKNILNIALAGHGGAGKTSIIESMLYLSGASDRLGKIADGNTICDFDPEEVKRKASVSTAVAPVEWKNKKLNFIDTPGLFDFEGGLWEGVRAADTVMIAVSGKNGVSVGTEKAVKAAESRGLSKVFFVNGLCDESARFYRVFETLKASFGPSVCPVVVPFIVDGQANCYVNLLEYKAYAYSPDGKVSEVPMPDMGDRLEGLRTAIYEAVAETSDEMFEKYFSGEQFTPEEIIVGVVGTLQFDVLTYRLKNEYNVDIILEHLPYEYIRWIENKDEIDPAKIIGTSDMKRIKDLKGNPLLIFVHSWAVNTVLDKNPGLKLSEFGRW